MTPVFIISEYNPFHTGHGRMIEEIRDRVGDAVIVSVMSAPFVQHGEPALFPPDVRAKAAVCGGADLVLSLPFPYCAAGARFFAAAGVRVAAAFASLRPVIAFGSECGDLDLLRRIAEESEKLRLFEKNGEERPDVPYPEYLSRAVGESLGEKAALELKKPNNILGVEYLAALMRECPGISALTVKRTGGRHDADAGICSSALRNSFYSGNEEAFYSGLPPLSAEVFREAVKEDRYSLGWDGLSDAVLGILRMFPDADSDRYADAGGGLGSRILAAAGQASSVGELFELCATKRYTNARIRRAVLSMAAGVTEEDLKTPPEFVNVLALNTAGRAVLGEYGGDLAIVTRPAGTDGGTRLRTLYLKAMSLYDLSLKKRRGSRDFMRKTPFTDF